MSLYRLVVKHSAEAYVILVWIIAPILAGAARICDADWREWKRCQSDRECVSAKDECGIERWTVNRRFLSKLDTLRECAKTQKATCPGETVDAAPTVKCHNKICLRLSDVIGEAIAKDERALLESSLREAGGVDISLSHVNETPLTLAALNSRVELVELLLSKGAAIDHQTTTGYSALMFAAMSRDSDAKAKRKTVELLLGKGANRNLKNRDGETAAVLARKAKNQDIAKLFESR